MSELQKTRIFLVMTSIAIPILLVVSFPSNYIVNSLIFFVLPYLAIFLFIGGLIYNATKWLRPKQLTGLRTVSIVPKVFTRTDVLKDVMKRILGFYTLPKMEGDRTLIVGSMMFHYGMWSWIISHLLLVFGGGFLSGMYTFPDFIYDPIGDYVARPAAILALVGLVILTARRVATPKMRSISSLGDYVPLGLLLMMLLAGLAQILSGGKAYMDTVAFWLLSILSFSPNAGLMSSVDALTLFYVVPALIFVALVPLSKMVHMISYLFNPTITKSSHRVGGIEIPLKAISVDQALSSGGGHHES